MSAGSINAAIAASRFFFTVTLERPDLVLPLTTVNKPRQGVLQTISFRANALNSRGIVGSGNPGWFAPTSWWSGGDSNFGLSGMRSWMSGNLSVSLKAKDSISESRAMKSRSDNGPEVQYHLRGVHPVRGFGAWIRCRLVRLSFWKCDDVRSLRGGGLIRLSQEARRDIPMPSIGSNDGYRFAIVAGQRAFDLTPLPSSNVTRSPIENLSMA